MLKTLGLILPVLFPSWRFFQAIEPSPRVEWAMHSKRNTAPVEWHAFRPRPSKVTPLQMVKHLFWNPHGNDALFVVSCSERIKQQPTAHSIAEITWRIQHDIKYMRIDTTDKLLQFRLVFQHREDTELVQEVVFVSDGDPAAATKTARKTL